jgi:TPP-dependent pyruvate/acetoin dehydrogenase alpha subunit
LIFRNHQKRRRKHHKIKNQLQKRKDHLIRKAHTHIAIHRQKESKSRKLQRSKKVIQKGHLILGKERLNKIKKPKVLI